MGTPITALLKLNRDNKKMTIGTQIAAEAGLLSCKDHTFDPHSVKSCQKKVAATYLTQQVYSRPKNDSWTRLVEVRTEAGKSRHADIVGKGTVSSIRSAILYQPVSRPLDNLITEHGLPFTTLPAVIDFGFRWFHKHCPVALADAVSGGFKYHFDSTLAAKVMLFLTATAYPYSGADPERFGEYVTVILRNHRRLYGDQYVTLKGRPKTLDADTFFQTCMFFQGELFNSGVKAAGLLLSKLTIAAKEKMKEYEARSTKALLNIS